MKKVFCDICYDEEYKNFNVIWENSYCAIFVCLKCGTYYLYFYNRKKYLVMKQELGTIIDYIKREIVMEPKRKEAERKRK